MFIREVMQVFLMRMHNRLNKDNLNIQTLSANFLTTSIFYTQSANQSTGYKTNHQSKSEQNNTLFVNLES